MKYTESQIQKAKLAYNSFIKFTTVESYEPQLIGYCEAEQRCEFHNKTVNNILNGDKELEKKWKLFFLNEEVKKEQKTNEIKAKLNANKEASEDVLKPIKNIKKLGDFGKWLNSNGNKYRQQHFSKKYTIESVNAFLLTL